MELYKNEGHFKCNSRHNKTIGNKRYAAEAMKLMFYNVSIVPTVAKKYNVIFLRRYTSAAKSTTD